jgi:adenylate cyclase class 2
MSSLSGIETEIKIKIEDLSNIKRRILNLGFKSIAKESFEHNIIFETKDRSLKKNHLLLRLRKYGDRNILTFKRPAKTSFTKMYKVREEVETEVSDFNNTREILLSLGYEIVFIYEKYREILEKGSIKVMLDHTPIGNFIEVEASEEQIDGVVSQLGYNKQDYITSNYWSIFKKLKKTGFMIFQ